MTADRWCAGAPPAFPHVAPTVAELPGGARLCEACWRRWQAADREVAR